MISTEEENDGRRDLKMKAAPPRPHDKASIFVTLSEDG